MFSLLIVIYIAFISLGLPDSLLGSAWPVMHIELGVPLASAGILSMIISAGTIISSLLSDRVIRRFGTGIVTAVSVAMTALALLGFSVLGSFPLLCLVAVPYGLGAGAVDAALNNYVALHYSSRHMSWLHAFWGVGATISPNIMSFCLTRQMGWQSGYRIVGLVQVAFVMVLVFSLKQWQRGSDGGEGASNALTLRRALRIQGAPLIMIGFFAMCAAESIAMLWGASYLVDGRGVDPELAAFFAGLFCTGEMVGRFLNGFVADRFGDRRMIRVGAIGMLIGIALMLLPVKTNAFSLAGLLVLGLGTAPVYPCIIHSTPATFGKENSQSLVGIQMASAYTGSTLMPPLFGLVAQHISIRLFPAVLLFFAALLLVMTERLYRMKAEAK